MQRSLLLPYVSRLFISYVQSNCPHLQVRQLFRVQHQHQQRRHQQQHQHQQHQQQPQQLVCEYICIEV